MSNIIPRLSSMITPEFGQRITLSLSDTGGVEETDVGVSGSSEVGGGESSSIFNGPALLPPAGNLDFSGAKEIFAQLEELVSLFYQMAFENKKRNSISASSGDIAQVPLSTASTTGDESTVGTMAMISLVVTVSSVPFFIFVAPLSGETGVAAKEEVNLLRASARDGVKESLKTFELGTGEKAVVIFASSQNIQDFLGVFLDSVQAAAMGGSLNFKREGDRLQPIALPKQTADCVVGFKEATMKMNETLHTLNSAQMKAEEAASRA